MSKEVYVIWEIDYCDNESLIIGVANTKDDVERMIKEYYGLDVTSVSDFKDVQESGIENTRTVHCGDIGVSRVIVNYFNINEI